MIFLVEPMDMKVEVDTCTCLGGLCVDDGEDPYER
ncbi:hypothetical protein SAMN05216583_1422 [Selenomonas sp. KH1T6]|nr:hypothetical protein SAMN05216583_1422 [Selenomonas ruminantium]